MVIFCIFVVVYRVTAHHVNNTAFPVCIITNLATLRAETIAIVKRFIHFSYFLDKVTSNSVTLEFTDLHNHRDEKELK